MLATILFILSPLKSAAQRQQLVYNPQLSKAEIEKLPVINKMPKATIYGKKVKTFNKSNVPAAKRIMKAGENENMFWVNITKMESWGYSDSSGVYKLAIQQPPQTTLLHYHPYMDLSGGAAYVDGYYYGLTLDLSWYQYGILFESLYKINAETWEMESYKDLDDITLGAMETAQAQDGTVYGQFYNSDLTGFEYGTIDYTTLQRTTIGTAATPMLVLAVDKDNKLYGIGADGYLYGIDTSNGKETQIGSTGLVVAKSDGSTYGQTGEIDPNTNTFFWAAIDSTGTTAMYTVNLTTGKAEKYSDYSEGTMQIQAMVPVKSLANDDAPAKVDSNTVVLSFPNGSTDGTITFTAPNTTFIGDELTGELDYEIVIDDTINVQGKVMAGETATANVSTTTGNHVFAIRTSNEDGKSPRTRVKAYIGFDTPVAIDSLKLENDETNGKMNLTWNAPTKGVNNGYLGELTYNLYRITDGVENQIAENLNATSYSDSYEVSEALHILSYKVEAVNNDQVSQPTYSNAIKIGSELALPYLEDFNSQDQMMLFSTSDADNDGSTWEYYEETWGDVKCVRVGMGDNSTVDDWLFTSPVRLKPNYKYTFRLTSWTDFDHPETFEVKMGNAATVEAMTQAVIDETEAGTTHTISQNKDISVDEEGLYYFGIHCNSQANYYYLYVDSIGISSGISVLAPDSVKELSATAGSNGQLSAQLTFNVPSLAINGTSLQNNVDVSIERNGEQIAKLTGLTPGSSKSWTDSDIPASGIYTYSLTTSNENGDGQTATANTYVGIDTPEAPVILSTTDAEAGKVTITWEEASTTGIHGGYVNPAEIEYSIAEGIITPFGEIETGDTLVKITGATTCTFDYDTDSGDQTMTYWVVTGTNEAGNNGVVAYMMTGTPYELPFEETFANQQKNYFWIYGGSVPRAISLGYSDASASDDGGSAVLSSSQADITGYATTGKIAISGAQNPSLSFAYKESDSSLGLSVSIITPDGKATKLADLSNSSDFTTQSFKLNDFTDERYIKVQFDADFAVVGTINIDDVKVTEGSSDAIEGIVGDEAAQFDVYSVNGTLERSNTDNTEGLSKGVHIVKTRDSQGNTITKKIIVK
ncbi:MAG: choice-of-anchor J domain-containing protein [Prevotella sp.]